MRRLIVGPLGRGALAITGVLILSTGLLAAVGEPAAATPATLYASASGSGTACSTVTPCSLTEALSLVGPGGTIALVTSGMEATQSTHYVGNFTVNTPSTSVTSPVNIEPAPGVVAPILDGNASGTVLTVNGGIFVTIAGVTIMAGDAKGSFAGGGILNSGGTVTVKYSTLSGNAASAPGGTVSGGIFNSSGATITVENSTLSGNTASAIGPGAVGGGIYNEAGTLIVENSTLSANTGSIQGASQSVGGIYNQGGMLTVENSTLSGNTGSNQDGLESAGGVLNALGTITVENSTISGNGGSGASVANGGGILNDGGTGSIKNSTISGNTASSAFFVGGGILSRPPLTLTASIVAFNGGGDCGLSITNDGFNLDSDNTCGFGGTFKIADLGQLLNNGGPTDTMALLVTSPTNPAVGTVTKSADCPSTDQRGFPRPSTNCDIGAFQTGTLPIALPNGTTGVTYTATVTAAGVTSPSFNLAGTLPPGLAMSSSGDISGVPTSTGTPTFTFTVAVTNGGGFVEDETFSIHICGGRFRSC